MSNPYKKIPPNSPITAFSITAWNAMLDMLAWYQKTIGRNAGPLKGLVDWDQSVFRVKNNTGADQYSYAVVGLDGPIYTPSDGDAEERELQNQTSQLGVEPTVADHAGLKWGVYLEAVPSGAIGRCCLSGVVPVRVYINSTSDKCVDIIDSETVGSETVYLGTGATGAQILWMDDGSAGDIVWSIVRLASSSPGARRCKAQLTGTLTATSASTSVDHVTATDGGSSPTSSETETLTVYIQLNPSSSGGYAGVNDTWCYIEYHSDDDKWYIYDMPCEA